MHSIVTLHRSVSHACPFNLWPGTKIVNKFWVKWPSRTQFTKPWLNKTMSTLISSALCLWQFLSVFCEFFPLCFLICHHTVLKSLNLQLAFSPVLVFSHTVLHSVMQLGTACFNNHVIHWVLLIFTRPPAVMGLRGRGGHREGVTAIQKRGNNWEKTKSPTYVCLCVCGLKS